MQTYAKFNDLFNRINILEEATSSSSSAWKGAIKKSGLTPILKNYKNQKTGQGVGASSRTKNQILLRALYHRDYLTDELFDILRKKATSSTFIANEIQKADPEVFNRLFYSHPEVDETGVEIETPPLIDSVLDDIKQNPTRYLDVQLTNIMGKNYKQEPEEEVEPPITSKVAEIDGEIGEVVDDLYGEYFDERYIVEIQVIDPNDAVKIRNKVEAFADEDGVDIVSKDGYNLISFSFASDSESANARALADKVKEIGVQKLYDLLQQDIERFTDRFEIYITEPGNVNIQPVVPAANRAQQDRTPYSTSTKPPVVDQQPDKFDAEEAEEAEELDADVAHYLDKTTVTESYTAHYLTEQQYGDDPQARIANNRAIKDRLLKRLEGPVEDRVAALELKLHELRKEIEYYSDKKDYTTADRLNFKYRIIKAKLGNLRGKDEETVNESYTAHYLTEQQYGDDPQARIANNRAIKDRLLKRLEEPAEDRADALELKLHELRKEIEYYTDRKDYTTATRLNTKYRIIKAKLGHLRGEDENTVNESYTLSYLSDQAHKDRLLKPKEKFILFKDKMKPKTIGQLAELRSYGL